MVTFGDCFASWILSEPRAACFRPASEIRTKATPMVDIQSATTEIREEKKKEEETTGQKYNGLPLCPITQGDHNNYIHCAHRGSNTAIIAIFPMHRKYNLTTQDWLLARSA